MFAALAERVRRLRPGRVPAPYLAWAIACWVLTAALAVLALIPGLTDSIVAEQTGASGFIGIFAAPLGIRLLVTAACAVLTGTLLVSRLVREERDSGGARRVAREVTLAAAGGFPVLALAADRAWGFAAAALVVFVLAEVAAPRRAARTAGETAAGERRSRNVVAALLAAGSWAVLFVAQLAGVGATGSWVWVALFGFAAAFAAFGSYYGVARAAESRSKRLRRLFRDDLPILAVVGVVVAVVILTVLRLTVAREVFPAPDPELWAPFGETPLSWAHAVVIAALIVGFGASSVRRPLRRSHERGITAGLAVAGNAGLVLAVLVIVLGMFVAAATGSTFLPDIPPMAIAALKFAGVLAILLVAALPRYRRTAARALAVITGAYLVPLTLHGLLVQAGVALPSWLAGFPASPLQVTLPLIAVAVLAVIIPPLRRRLGTGLVVRLALVPFVAVHAGWLLPAVWSDLGRIVMVVGIVLALLFLMPKPATDPTRHTLAVLRASGAQLLALVVFALALPSFVDDPAVVVLGLFWLTVAVIAALTVRTMAGVDDIEEIPDER